LALLRASLPGATVTLSVMAANRAFTGDALSAGALLKLLSRDPYLSDVDRARELALNLFHLFFKVIAPLRTWPIFAGLALVGAAHRRTRGMAAPSLAGALAWTLLVSWNGAARFQNFRYYVPALVLVLVASAIGVAAVARVRALRAVVAAVAALAIVPILPGAGAQIDHFARASKNVHDQQVEVGRRLARSAPPRAIVLVGDAGAIPYVSGRAAIDALGLGGYHGVPFARAARHGEAATVELIERLAPAARPTHLALYPNWFRAITSTFGHEIDRVTIDDNVICGGPTKGIYLADWSALAGADRLEDGVIDVVDVADVVSEEEHAYVSPAPRGGWTTLRVAAVPEAGGRGAARVFDGGRILPEGTSESFRVLRGAARPATIVIRTAPGAGDVEALVRRPDGTTSRASFEKGGAGSDPGAWATLRATIEAGLSEGDGITLRAARGEYRDFHVWITR
jgi:hypothetical protein